MDIGAAGDTVGGLVSPGASSTAARSARRGVALALARRLGSMIAVLVVLSMGVFALMYLAPGGPEQALTSGRPVGPQALAALRERYNLDDPLPVQYLSWVGDAVTLDLGRSYRSQEKVTSLIASRGGITLQLAGLAFVITLVVSLPLALLAATRRRGAGDRLVSGFAVMGVAAPPFALGVLLLYVFGVKLAWFPVYGVGTGGLDRLRHLMLPAVALTVGVIALTLKIGRTSLISVIEQEYVAFARARGLSRPKVLMTYVVRNSLGPIATAAGLTFGTLVAGTVLVEQTFAIPGAGSLLVDAVNHQDVPVVQGLGLAISVLVLGVNLLTDVTYALIDPRIDLSRSIA